MRNIIQPPLPFPPRLPLLVRQTFYVVGRYVVRTYYRHFKVKTFFFKETYTLPVVIRPKQGTNLPLKRRKFYGELVK